jgi:hypothetical protein
MVILISFLQYFFLKKMFLQFMRKIHDTTLWIEELIASRCGMVVVEQVPTTLATRSEFC